MKLTSEEISTYLTSYKEVPCCTHCDFFCTLLYPTPKVCPKCGESVKEVIGRVKMELTQHVFLGIATQIDLRPLEFFPKENKTEDLLLVFIEYLDEFFKEECGRGEPLSEVASYEGIYKALEAFKGGAR